MQLREAVDLFRSQPKSSSLFAFMLGLSALLVPATAVHAQQEFPAKPIRLIVPAAPGEGPDPMARMLARNLTAAFKQSVVVDNRPGGNYIIGVQIALRANPDGYTVILVPSSYAANAAFHKLPYDALNDVTPIARIGETGFAVTLHLSIPVATIKELIAHDKGNPGKLHYGAVGAGSGSHRAAELFNQMAGTRLNNVPYQGAGAALNDLLGGQVQVFFGNLPMMIPQIKSKRLRGVAVTTAKRSSALPDIPTVGETVAGYEAVAWQGVLGPKALPRDLVARWNTDINRVLNLPEVRERMAAIGMDPVDGSPEHFLEFLNREVAKWQEVVKFANIKPGN